MWAGARAGAGAFCMGVRIFKEIAELIEPALHGMGFELVQVRMLGGGRRTLQIMAEPMDRTRVMTVDDCAEISRAISAILDVADPIPGSYLLEVSSPGIDRPLVRPADFERFAGHEARIDTDQPVAGRRRLRGRLEGIRDNLVTIEVGSDRFEIPLERIRRAKLVLTEALLAAAPPLPEE